MLMSVRDGASKTPEVAVADVGGVGSEEHDAAKWLVDSEGLDGLPPALQQAGAYLGEHGVSVTEYVARCRERELELFGARPVPPNPWDAMEAWLSQLDLIEAGPMLKVAGSTAAPRSR
jgi:hypothetical protein